MQTETDTRGIWRLFAQNYHLFAGTPSRLWLDHVFDEVFGLEVPLSNATADLYFDHINACLDRPEFRPRALFDRFNIEVLATTESPLDSLEHHRRSVIATGMAGLSPPTVLTRWWIRNLRIFPEISSASVRFPGKTFPAISGYLEAHRKQREFFKSMGATSTDHGHPTAATADLERQAL